MTARVWAVFVTAICLSFVVIGLGHLAWYLGLGVLVIAGAVLGVYLTQPRGVGRGSSNISIKTSGPAEIDIKIDDPRHGRKEPDRQRYSGWVPDTLYGFSPGEVIAVCGECEYETLTSGYGTAIRRVLTRTCPKHTAQWVPVVDAADPEAERSAPIYNDIPGLIGYVQRNGQLEPIMDPDYRGSPSIFPQRPGGRVDPFPSPYAPDSDVVKWGEERARREYEAQQRRDGVA
jgi:hypothetical protein